MTAAVEAILFDVNGTLRVREAHEPTQQTAICRLHEWIGRDDLDWDELAHRQKAYSEWAQANLSQLSEAEIWGCWILPDIPQERIEPVAAELMVAWSERKGRSVPVVDADRTLVALRARVYRLGIISNSMSTLDIPRSLESFGWKDYFEVVLLSSDLKIRKPSPEPFREAARRMNLSPGQCACVGNRVSKDIPGCKRAGFALGLVVEPTNRTRTEEQDHTVPPDIVIHSLSELLEIFPSRF